MGATGMKDGEILLDKSTLAEFRLRNKTPSSSNPGYSPPTNLYDGAVTSWAAAFAYHPSLGLNTTMLGGSAHRGAFPKGRSDKSWTTPSPKSHYTTRTSQVQRTDQIILMASSRGVDIATTGGWGGTSWGTQPSAWTSGSKVVPGFWEIIPPRGGYPTPVTDHATPQAPNSGWLSQSNRFDKVSNPMNWGYIDCRHKGKAVAVMTDGHTQVLDLAQLRDMRRWSNNATGPNYPYN